MVVIAAIWFLVFLPSIIKKDEQKVQDREQLERSKQIAKVHLGEEATQAIAVNRGRATFATLASISAVVATFSVLDFFATGRSLILGVVASALTALGLVLTLKLNAKYRQLLASVAVRKVPLSAPVAPVIKRSTLENKTNDFTPIEVPGQAYLKTGAIEIVELADVVPLTEESAAAKIESIDEIMRRRRHVG